MKPVQKLLVIITVAWLLILSESYAFFYIIRPTAPNIHESVFSAALKIGSVGSLIVIWVAVLFSLEYFFFRR